MIKGTQNRTKEERMSSVYSEVYNGQPEQDIPLETPSPSTKNGNTLRLAVLITAILFTILNTAWTIFRAAITMSTSFDKFFTVFMCFVSVVVGHFGVLSAINQLKPKTQLQFSVLYVVGLAVIFIAEISFIMHSLSKIGSREGQTGGPGILIGAVISCVLFFVIYGTLGLLGVFRIMKLRKITH